MASPIDCQGLSEKQNEEVTSSCTTESETMVSSSDGDLESGDSPTSCSVQKNWLARWLTRSTKVSNTNESDVAETDEEEYEDPYSVETRFLEDKPKGYPQVAVFQSSDRNFLQYRAFGFLRSRVLSDLQYDVERLEDELDELDTWERSNNRGRKLTSKRRDGFRTAEELEQDGYPKYLRRCRVIILSELRLKLMEYDEFLLKAKEVMSLQRPSKRDYESVRTWFRDHRPLVDKEAQFIRRKEDMISLRSGRESAGFEGAVEQCLNWIDDTLQKKFRCQLIRHLFLTPELRMKTDSQTVRYYAPSRVNQLVNILITVVIFTLLVLPVIIMYEVTDMGSHQTPLNAIGVLIVFTLIFGMAVSSLTTAKRHELFGASAAYAAVLVVFIGNFGVQQVDPASPAAWAGVLHQSLT